MMLFSDVTDALVCVQVPTASTYSEGNTALNKCLWHSSGHHIAVGDDAGRIFIYDVNEVISRPHILLWRIVISSSRKLLADEQT